MVWAVGEGQKIKKSKDGVFSTKLNFLFFLETAFFTSIQIRDTGRKKGLLSFYSVTIYVCMYVCMYVCVYVSALQPTPFDLESCNLDWRVLEQLSENAIFFFLKFFFFSELWPLFHFTQFYLYHECESTDYNE